MEKSYKMQQAFILNLSLEGEGRAPQVLNMSTNPCFTFSLFRMSWSKQKYNFTIAENFAWQSKESSQDVVTHIFSRAASHNGSEGAFSSKIVLNYSKTNLFQRWKKTLINLWLGSREFKKKYKILFNFFVEFSTNQMH